MTRNRDKSFIFYHLKRIYDTFMCSFVTWYKYKYDLLALKLLELITLFYLYMFRPDRFCLMTSSEVKGLLLWNPIKACTFQTTCLEDGFWFTHFGETYYIRSTLSVGTVVGINILIIIIIRLLQSIGHLHCVSANIA